MQFASLSILLVSAVAVIVDGEKLIKRKFEFPSLLKEELKHAATRKPRVKRAGFAAALAPAMANAAGDVLSNVGKKLVEGATTVLTAGATHVAEAEAKRKENEKEAEEGITNAKGQTAAYDRATISLMPRKGEIGFGDSLSIEPPGFAVSASFSKDEKEPETQHSSNEFVKFPFGLGFAMLNGCYRTGYQPGDPCYAATLKMTSNLCLDMLDAAAFIGVGFNGRGDYSAEYRKKSVIQRLCASKGSFGGAQVPDTMNVFGVYDTEVMQTTFSSATQYQEYLESKAAVSSYKHSFSEALRKSFGVSAKFSYGLFSGAKASIDTKKKKVPTATLR